MLSSQTHTMERTAAFKDGSTFFFVGPFDDTSFYRGPQVLKPISTHFTHMNAGHHPTPPLSENGDAYDDHNDDDDCAALGDDEEYSEDELPPSPRRRHSGAMSISSEDLPFCYDRDALRRDTAAHRAKHQHKKRKVTSTAAIATTTMPSTLTARGSEGVGSNNSITARPKTTFGAHETWDSELDGPHMALWVPGNDCCTGVQQEKSKKRRLGMLATTSQNQADVPLQHVDQIDGPMMGLWGV